MKTMAVIYEIEFKDKGKNRPCGSPKMVASPGRQK
jgi:hypothetical protein